MNSNPHLPPRRPGLPLVSFARALPAVLALAAFAVPSTRADVVFTRSTGNGEAWAQYSATFTPTKTGNYTLSFSIPSGPSYSDSTIYLDDVHVTTGATELFQSGFENPVIASGGFVYVAAPNYETGSVTSGGWVYHSTSGIINGAGLAWDSFHTAKEGNQRAFLQTASSVNRYGAVTTATTMTLTAGQTYTVTFWQASRTSSGSINGTLTYAVSFNYVPPPPVRWVDWRDNVVENGVTKYRGYLNVTRPDGTTTTVTVKFSGPRGIAFYQTGAAGEEDFWQQRIYWWQHGPWKRDPATSPYTNSVVDSIPTGSDIIGLRYAQKNTLEFTDAAGAPLAIASPVFAYVSLNGNGYGFNQDFDILSYGHSSVGNDAGYWGPGTSYKSVTTVNGAPQYQLLGTGEPHGSLQFRGSFSSVTWDSLSDEYWNGFTIGLAQLAQDVPIANAGPDQTVTANSINGATVQLNGSVSGSTKTPFTYTWTGPFGTATGQNPTVTMPVGNNQAVTLVVTDASGATDSDTVVITVLPNPAPVITSPTAASATYGAAFSYTITATNSPTSFGASGLPAGLTRTGAVISGTPTVTGIFGVNLSAQNSGGTGTGSVLISIGQATPTITVNGYTGVYDGNAHGATGTATGVGGVSLLGLNLGATFTNVPGGTASWSFHDPAGNYADASGTAAIVINKANATVVVTPYNVEYDGLPHSATVASITGVNGETGAAVGTVTLNTTHTNVGTYSDTWSFTGGTNYNNIAATPITDVIKDTTPPTITSLSTNAPTLWPPNHKMVAVTVSATASDLVGVTSLKIISTTSNEPDNGLGDGDTAGDIQITADLTINLRAERSGKGNGRIYTITVEARDAAGNASTKTVTVSVPKSQGGK